MGRALVCQNDAAAFSGFAFRLALHQSRDTGGQERDVPFLPGHDVGQVLDGAGEVRGLFLQACDVIHTPQIGRTPGEIKPRLPPVVALARGAR